MKAQGVTPGPAGPLASPPKRPRRRRCGLRRVLLGATLIVLLLVASGWATLVGIDYLCIPQPPPLPAARPVEAIALHDDGVTRRLGDHWLTQADGLLRMRIAGDPYTLGFANAALTAPFIPRQEEELLDLVRSHYPQRWRQLLLWKLVQLRTRGLADHVAPGEHLELLGLARGHADPRPDLGRWAPLYYRILNYHAAHDLSHAVMDAPLFGCTTFVAAGPQSRDGHLWIGRNFDFAAARAFDLNKVVIRVEPEGGIGFLSIGWPGMMGVVTGINDQRVLVSVNGVRAADRLKIGTPVSLVIRRVLQSAHTLDEAVAILRDSTVFVSDLYLVADGKDGRAVVVEKTPLRSAVRTMDDGPLVIANHFLTPELAGDPENQRLRDEGTTVDRHARMEALLAKYSGQVDAATAAVILRDRRGPQGRDVGLGNEATLCPLVATHSVIVDATAGVVWVNTGPHQLGRYVPLRVDGTLATDQPTLPADDLLTQGDYQRFLLAHDLITQAQRLWRDGDRAEARRRLEQAAAQNPRFYLPYYLRAQLDEQDGDPKSAATQWRAALDRYPAFGAERAAAEQHLTASLH